MLLLPLPPPPQSAFHISPDLSILMDLLRMLRLRLLLTVGRKIKIPATIESVRILPNYYIATGVGPTASFRSTAPAGVLAVVVAVEAVVRSRGT